MMRSEEASEIPGYYMEPGSGRHFRIVSMGPPLLSLLNAAREEAALMDFSETRRTNTHKYSFPKFKNVLNCLSANQMGSVDSFNYQDEISVLKAGRFHLTSELIHPPTHLKVKARLLKAGTKHLYGQWLTESNGTMFYAFRDFAKANQPPLNDSNCFEISHLAPRNIAVDMCEGFAHPISLLYVYNDLYTGFGISHLSWHNGFRNGAAVNLSRSFNVNSAIWCCCSNKSSGLYALGIEDGIYVHNSNFYLYTKHFKGDVFGVNFNKTGQIIYAGINKGNLVTVDTRIHDPVGAIKLNNRALTEVSLLDNENYILCAGLDNFLCQVDLRMQRKVVDYIGDVRKTIKSPISFNETYNLLCSTGSDNVTRVWSLRGGRPVKTLLSPIRGEDSRSIFMCDDSLKLKIYIACKNKMFIHEW